MDTKAIIERVAGSMVAKRYKDLEWGVSVSKEKDGEIELKVHGPAGHYKILAMMVKVWMDDNKLFERDGWVFGNNGNPHRWTVENENDTGNFMRNL